MKKKKGFTLIELLAVIVILAIIALIATPAIINVIENARKKAFEDTSYGVLEGLRLDYVERTAHGTTAEEKTFDFPNSGLKLSGEEPAYGEAKIDSKGNISFALADKDKKWCTKKNATSEKVYVEDYTEESCKIDETSGGGVTNAVADGTVVYFDPVAGTKCDTYTEANSATGVKTGCMKWYTFGGNNSSDKVNLLLDHNTTARVAWNTNNDNTDSSEIDEIVRIDANGWLEGLKPRLITADEIAKITKHPTFNSVTTTSNGWFYFDTNTTQPDSNSGLGTSKYKWLFDRTYNCTNYGCNISDVTNRGYWTYSNVNSISTDIWYIDNSGMMGNISANRYNLIGVRPVITISKSSVL